MGQDAINAVNATAAKIGKLIPGNTAAQLRSLIGVTPMIGMNDVPGETFTLTVPQTLLNDALGNGFGMLSMWAATRDRNVQPPRQGRKTSAAASRRRRWSSRGFFKKFDP